MWNFRSNRSGVMNFQQCCPPSEMTSVDRVLWHSPLTHGSVLINRISSKNQQSLAYCQFFLRYQKIKCDGSNLDSFTWGFGWFSSFIYCRTPCCHCDTVKTSNFSQIQPNLAKIWQNRETSAYYKKISYRPKMKCK